MMNIIRTAYNYLTHASYRVMIESYHDKTMSYTPEVKFRLLPVWIDMTDTIYDQPRTEADAWEFINSKRHRSNGKQVIGKYASYKD